MISVNDTIAIVGMSGLFPGALDTSALWANVCAKFDATRDVSPGRRVECSGEKAGHADDGNGVVDAHHHKGTASKSLCVI